jgi:hypothetical protein
MNILNAVKNQFINAFDNTFNITSQTNNLTVGENESLAQQTPAQTKLDFDGILCEYFLLMREATEEKISEVLERLIYIIDSTLITKEKQKEFFIKLLKISLFIRNPRKGKGEKQVFYNIIKCLYQIYKSHQYHSNLYKTDKYQTIVFTMIDVLGDFGYYRDYNNLYMQIEDATFRNYLLQKYESLLQSDNQKQNANELSLAAKWAPREGSKYDIFAKNLAVVMFPNNDKNTSYKNYRKMLSELNKKINTVQTYMCQKHWRNIYFANVPSVAMTNLTKAFQDEKVSNKPKTDRVVKPLKKRYGRKVISKIVNNRRHHEGDADYEDREKCRQNLINHISSGKKINSSVTNLSDIIQRYLNGYELDITWEAQWTARVKEIQEFINTLTVKPSIFPMVDLSSSMTGDPIINAITLGMFTSIIMDNPIDQEEFCFANRFMSFAETPQLVKLPRFSTFDNTKPASLKEKVTIMHEWTNGGRWGGNTNIHAALDLLLNIATTNNVPQKDMPQILAIFSDMQFDAGDNSWTKTSYDNISDKFKNAGYEVPHVLFWNLRDNAVGFQVKANTPNSSMLSGYSTRMLDLFLTGDINNLNELETNDETEDTEENNFTQKTTLDLINKALSHEMFEKYNDVFNNLCDNLF